MRNYQASSGEPAGTYFIVRLRFFKKGPFSHEDIKNLLLTGRLHAQSKIWRIDLDTWTAIDSIPDFQDVLSELPPSPIAETTANLKTYFHGKTAQLYITGILALIAFTPIDNPWYPYWYNDTVYLFKNPNSEGFWPHDVQFETSRNGRGYGTFHYTFNGILAGWNWVEFVLYVGGLWTVFLFKEFRLRVGIRKAEDRYSAGIGKRTPW